MVKIVSILIFLLPCILPAQSSVWKITKDDHSLYIGGTCHLLRPSDFPLPVEFEVAYTASETLVFEMNPATANTHGFALKLLNKAKYNDSRSLKSVLSKQTYAALNEQCVRNGLSMETLDKMKPFMVIMTLLLQELSALGISEEGVDLFFYKRALNDKKQIHSLETPDFQIDLITSIDEGIEDQIVSYGLKDINKIQKRFDELIYAWRTGKIESLEENFIDQIKNYPTLYSRILVTRNLEWAKSVKRYLDDSKVEFILVGVAHLAGEKGLLTLLKEEGYAVEQLAIEN